MLNLIYFLLGGGVSEGDVWHSTQWILCIADVIIHLSSMAIIKYVASILGRWNLHPYMCVCTHTHSLHDMLPYECFLFFKKEAKSKAVIRNHTSPWFVLLTSYFKVNFTLYFKYFGIRIQTVQNREVSSHHILEDFLKGNPNP